MGIRHAPPKMNTNRLLPIGIFLLSCSARLAAAEPDLREQLRDALYTEEVARDPEKAAKQYEDLLARHDAQKTFAAAALFRLAEVRRKQNRKDDAIQLYQRLIFEFPKAETEAKLARENLAALGGKPPEAVKAVNNPEAEELARLQALADTSPDILLDPQTMFDAAHQGWASVVKFLLAKGGRPDAEDALLAAAFNGNLEIVRMLTEAQAEIPDAVAAEAIWAAIDAELLTILEHLLQKGFKPGLVDSDYGKVPTFIRAVLEGKLRGAEVLLKHGAEINGMAEAPPGNEYRPCGTALHLTIHKGKFDAVQWLLEKGAKPDLPDPTYGLSPLHHAISCGRPGAIKIVETLLVAGAQPNRRSKNVILTDLSLREYLMNSTPLEMAVSSRDMNLELVKLLLKHGADPNLEGSKITTALSQAMGWDMLRGTELVKLLGDAGYRMTDPSLLREAIEKNDWNMVELLLKYGANPNARLGPDRSLLAAACKAGDANRIALLLKAGAKVNDVIAGKGLLQLASQSRATESELPCVKLLLDAGAKPDEEFKKNGYAGTPPAVREILLEKFTIPEHGKESEINLLIDKRQFLQTLSIATRNANSTIPELAPWMLENHTRIQELPYGDGVKLHWAIWRRGESGAWVKQEMDIKSSKPLPELRWGDVVTCKVEIAESVTRLPDNWQLVNRLPDAELWHLRKHISFPITVETDGKSREIQVRGDRLFFDPTKDEVPLGDIQKIAAYFWQKYLIMPTWPYTLIVSRKDWPDIRLSYDSKEAAKFRLQAGDRLKLEISAQVRENLAAVRGAFVTLKVEDYPFGKYLDGMADGRPLEASIPTLLQALVDTQVPSYPDWMRFTESKTANQVDLYGVDAFHQFTLLPHPDLTNLRIRRLQKDGSEKVIEVNLAKVIATATDQTTAEEARKADVPLQLGDVVEISLLKDRVGEPWKGFSAKEDAFFSKALGGRVQVTDAQSDITVRDLLYQAPRFVETETGWLPLPPVTGLPTLRGSWLTRETHMWVIRGEVESRVLPSSELFLRDGDDVRTRGGSQQARPRVRIPPPR
jgi:ankyrin repeat protein